VIFVVTHGFIELDILRKSLFSSENQFAEVCTICLLSSRALSHVVIGSASKCYTAFLTVIASVEAIQGSKIVFLKKKRFFRDWLQVPQQPF